LTNKVDHPKRPEGEYGGESDHSNMIEAEIPRIKAEQSSHSGKCDDVQCDVKSGITRRIQHITDGWEGAWLSA